MARKNDANKISRVQRRSEMVSGRLMILFVVATFLVVMLLAIENNGAAAMTPFRNYVCPVFMAVSAILVILFAVISAVHRNDSDFKAKNEFKILKPSAVICFFASLFAVSLLYYTVFTNNQNYKSIVVIIVLTALAFIHDCFGADFFWFSVFTAGGALLSATQTNGFAFTNIRTAVFSVLQILAFALPVLMAVVTALTDKNGMISLKGKKVNYLGRNASKLPFYILAALLIALNAVISFVNVGLMTYGFLLLFAFYLIVGITYAIKQLSR